MTQLLGLILVSFFVTSLLLVPFIDLLYYLKRRFESINNDKAKSQTPIHDQLMKEDIKTPSGAGILLILILIILSIFFALLYRFADLISLGILLFTLFSFGALGLIDDVKLIFTRRRGKFLGLSRGQMFVTQLILANIISSMLYFFVGLNNIYISGLGNFVIDFWYIPFASFVIVSFANAYNISDGLDGLSAGLLTICLFAFLGISSASLNLSLGSFIGIWIGALFAFLYFNIWPARIFLGDAGAFGFGATLGVVGLLTGKTMALAIIGGMFVVIVASSLIQIASKRFFKRKVLPVAPIHMYFKFIGWQESKIVVRFWLAQALFAIFGLWIGLISSSV